jgi:hypothetical protein
MTARKKAKAPEGNPFLDGFVDWMDSPDGEQSVEVMDAVWGLLEDVDVDAKARQLVWPDGQRLSIDESVQRIHAEHSQFPAEQIEDRVTSWLEMGYVPENHSEKQLDQLERLTERWIKAHYRGRRRT